MYIMEDGGEVENIVLSNYEEKGGEEAGMHNSICSGRRNAQGFEKMSPEEIKLLAKESRGRRDQT